MFKYNYKDYNNISYYELLNLDEFSNVSMPHESSLTQEVMDNFTITRTEVTEQVSEITNEVVKTLEDLKAEKLEELDNARDLKEQEAIETNKGIFSFGMSSHKRIVDTYTIMSDNDTREWTLTDGLTTVTMSKKDFKDILVAAMERSDRCHQKWLSLRAWVNSCETAEEVQNISWDFIGD